jgi:hypothetical protein
MTEKRFDSVYYEDFCRVITDNGKEINPLQVVDLLNELHEENMMLKEYNNKLMKQPLLFDVQTIPNTMRIMEANTQLEEENEQLKTTISRLIEQNRKNNDLLVSDIRLLEKALWCPNCTRNIKRLKELKKEFEND